MLPVYGGGAWPHYSAYQRNELASNGNYYETDAIAVRHGICGDPEQVRCIKQQSDTLYTENIKTNTAVRCEIEIFLEIHQCSNAVP